MTFVCKGSKTARGGVGWVKDSLYRVRGRAKVKGYGLGLASYTIVYM